MWTPLPPSVGLLVDGDETTKALAWVEKHCLPGKDVNPPARQHSPEQRKKEWKICVQMTQIIRDLMVGNPRLAELGSQSMVTVAPWLGLVLGYGLGRVEPLTPQAHDLGHQCLVGAGEPRIRCQCLAEPRQPIASMP